MLQSTIDALSAGSLAALMCIGIALVFSVMGLVNFAHGELIMVGAYAVLVVVGWPWYAAILIALLTSMIVALLLERLAFRPVRKADPTTMLVTSFAVAILLQSVVAMFAGHRAKSLDFGSQITRPVDFLGARVALMDLVTIAVTVALVVGVALFLKRTALGVQMRSAAEDFTMTRLLGVNANRVVAAAFALSGLLAGVGAVIAVINSGAVTPSMGTSIVILAFIGTVVGGLGSIAAAAMGGFLLGAGSVILQTVLPLSVRGFRDVFLYGLVILILLFRPQGLFVSRAFRDRV